MKCLCIIVLLFSVLDVYAQNADQLIAEGNEMYRKKEYDKAAASYEKALKADRDNSTAKFNLANAFHVQGKEEEAVKLYAEVTQSSAETTLKAKAYYNKGAVLSKLNKLEESIEAYKDALRLNPGDKQARENLQKALLELKKKNPPKKQNDQQKKNKPQEKQKQQQQPKMSQKEAEQRLKLLEQKEKELQQRMQQAKEKAGGQGGKDW
ncbi:MAG: tetratricopeptide repeat protein [Bacteroidetes bacterium]|nr:tetratricopeptide repeat protein [Bacteroidota bacterium]